MVLLSSAGTGTAWVSPSVGDGSQGIEPAEIQAWQFKATEYGPRSGPESSGPGASRSRSHDFRYRTLSVLCLCPGAGEGQAEPKQQAAPEMGEQLLSSLDSKATRETSAVSI